MKINGLVLAAGMSQRMGDFKPLMKIGNKTMIETTVHAMFEAGVDQVNVVVGYRGQDIEQVLGPLKSQGKSLQIFYNKKYDETQMLDSIQIGLDGMGNCDGFFLTPGDMPAISVNTYKTLMEYAQTTSAKVVFPVIDGYRKHPPYISSECRDTIMNFQGEGLRALWKEYEGEILQIPITDQGCVMDADYPEDFHKIQTYLEKS